MNSKLLRQVYEKAKEGEFAEVLRLIKDIKVETEIANNILINAANACYYNKVSSNSGKDDIYCLLSNMFSSVDKIDETHVVRYLQSVFHIIKYMCDKEWFDHLAEMEFIIVPKFFQDIPLKSIKDGKNAYHALIMKLCNSISVLSGAGQIDHNKYLLRLIKIILKANNKIHSTEETLTMARNLLNIIEELNFQNDQLCQFYFIVLEELEADLIKSVDCMEKITILLSNIFSTIVSDLIEAKEFQAARMFFMNVESRIRLSLNQQEILIAHILIKAVTCCFPSDTDEDMEDCKAQIASFKLSHEKMFYNIVRFLEEPFNSLLCYYKLFKCKVWCGLPSETVLNFLEFIRRDICSYLIFAQIKCSCGCSLEINYYGMLKIACKLSGLSKYYIDSNKNLSLKFYSEVVQLLNCCYEILKKLKDNNCDKWSQIYRELGTYAYNIGTSLFKQENVAFVDVYQCFLRNSLEFDGLTPTILNVKLNEVSFHMICEMELKNQRMESCMAFAALYCLLYQQKTNSVFQNWWIKSKIKLKEDSNIQQLTLVAILENQCKLVSSIVDPQQYLTREKKLELLTYELFCYKALWKSKESVMAAFSHIVAISEVPKIAEVLLQIFGDGEMQLHENMPAVFSIALKKLEYFLKTNSDHYVKMALAVLYYYNYKDSSRKTADQNRSEMERTMLDDGVYAVGVFVFSMIILFVMFLLIVFNFLK